jgi:hypothetical protein
MSTSVFFFRSFLLYVPYIITLYTQVSGLVTYTSVVQRMVDQQMLSFLFTTMWTVEPRINLCFDSPTHGLCFDSLTRDLFLTCTQGIFLFISDTHVLYIIYQTFRACMNLLYGKKPLTWNVGSLYMAANPHPC